MTYTRHRADGWPLCPLCGEDELWSDAAMLMRAATMEEKIGLIKECYNCGWRPGVDPAGQPIRDEIIQAAYNAGVVTEDSDDETVDLLYALADLVAIVQQVNEEAGPAADEAWDYE